MSKSLKPETVLARRGTGKGTDEKNATIDVYEGSKILVFGDLHLSGVYQGTHRDYSGSCIRVMSRIYEIANKVAEEGGLSAILFLGDVFGVKERNIKNPSFMINVVNFFQQLNALCNQNVYSVRGNHDYGDCPDFYLFEQLGFLRNPDYVDFLDGTNHQLRIHFMNYGAEDRKLDKAPDEVGNIVLAHNDFQVDGKTAWYGGKDVIDTKTMTNLLNIDLLLSGHIHTPLSQMITFTIGDGSADGSEVDFFIPGSPTRDSERIDEVFYVEFNYDGIGYDVNIEPFGLWPASEEFFERAEVPSSEEFQEESERTANLRAAFETLNKAQVFAGDISDQIRNLPYAKPEAKDLALDYLDKVTT